MKHPARHPGHPDLFSVVVVAVLVALSLTVAAQVAAASGVRPPVDSRPQPRPCAGFLQRTDTRIDGRTARRQRNVHACEMQASPLPMLGLWALAAR